MNTTSRGDSLTKAPAPSRAGEASLERGPRSQPSSLLQAITAGLQPEAAPYAAGLKDGEEGAAYRPMPDWSPERAANTLLSGDHDVMHQVFSYSCGWVRGRERSRHAL